MILRTSDNFDPAQRDSIYIELRFWIPDTERSKTFEEFKGGKIDFISSELTFNDDIFWWKRMDRTIFAFKLIKYMRFKITKEFFLDGKTCCLTVSTIAYKKIFGCIKEFD